MNKTTPASPGYSLSVLHQNSSEVSVGMLLNSQSCMSIWGSWILDTVLVGGSDQIVPSHLILFPGFTLLFPSRRITMFKFFQFFCTKIPKSDRISINSWNRTRFFFLGSVHPNWPVSCQKHTGMSTHLEIVYIATMTLRKLVGSSPQRLNKIVEMPESNQKKQKKIESGHSWARPSRLRLRLLGLICFDLVSTNQVNISGPCHDVPCSVTGNSGFVHFCLLFLILRIFGFSALSRISRSDWFSGFLPFSSNSRSGWFLFCLVSSCGRNQIYGQTRCTKTVRNIWGHNSFLRPHTNQRPPKVHPTTLHSPLPANRSLSTPPRTNLSHPPPHNHTLHTAWTKNVCSILSPNITLRGGPACQLDCELVLPSVNPQPWRSTNNSLGLPHAHSLSVCLFPWVYVVCVCFLLYLPVYLGFTRYVFSVPLHIHLTFLNFKTYIDMNVVLHITLFVWFYLSPEHLQKIYYVCVYDHDLHAMSLHVSVLVFKPT